MSNLNYSASDMYIRFNLQAVNGKHPPMKLKQVLWPQINKNTWLGWPALPWAGQKLDKKINTNSVWSVVYYYTRSIITLWMQSHENNNTPVILILIRVTIEQHAIAERNCNMHKSNCKLNLTTLNSRRHPTTTSGSAPVFVNSADSLFIYHLEMETFGSNKLFVVWFSILDSVSLIACKFLTYNNIGLQSTARNETSWHECDQALNLDKSSEWTT